MAVGALLIVVWQLLAALVSRCLPTLAGVAATACVVALAYRRDTCMVRVEEGCLCASQQQCIVCGSDIFCGTQSSTCTPDCAAMGNASCLKLVLR